MKEIALHVLDIAENGVAAGASEIRITLELNQKMLLLELSDNGRGMDPEELGKVKDPFYTSRTTRKVGLGIPLLKQQAELAGGSIELASEKGRGTSIRASFQMDHPDRQPLGDVEGVWLMLQSSYPAVEWMLSLKTLEGEFSLSSGEIKAALEVEMIRGVALTQQLKRMIRYNMEVLGIS